MVDIHGGNLVLPSSIEDGKGMLKILEKHKDSCLDSSDIINQGKAMWLGMKRKGGEWYRVDSNGDFVPLSFENWDAKSYTGKSCGADDETSCAYMNENGHWAFGLKIESCQTIALCPVCEITGRSVFSLKGLCSKNSPIDWNYYIRTDETHKIVEYEGYKFANLTKEKGQWVLRHPGIIANTSGDHPLGRKEWSYFDSTCEMNVAEKTSLTISMCYPGKEFTCNSGDCILLSKRCNQINECEDKSDEKNCHLVLIPDSYDKLIAPGSYGSREKTIGIQIKVIIKSIDIIDLSRMQIGLTSLVRMKWKDDRLQFESLNPRGNNFISDDTANKLWMPSENFIFTNSILGQVIKGQIRVINAKNLTRGEVDVSTQSIENYLYPGSKTRLQERVAYKILYRCNFQMTTFPFDHHHCQFRISLKVWNNNSFTLVKAENAVTYDGQSTWNQFRIENGNSQIVNDDFSTTFVFSLKISRLYANQMLTTFLPTCLLWSLAYFTLFINIENFSDRFIGTVTTLLVLVSLLNSVNEDLPKTSYFKCIDLWFLWFISLILFTTLFHILINYISHHNHIKAAKSINKIGILFFAIATSVFIVIYFSLTI